MTNWKSIRRSLRRPFETAAFRLLAVFIPILPRCAVVGLAKLAGKIALLLPLQEKRIGLKNIDAVFGASKTPKEKRFILATSFATFCQTMLDVFWFSRTPEKRIAKYVEIEPGPALDLFSKADPLICITAHMGSWEIMGQTMALQGVDMAAIAATVKNKTVDRILIQQRERTGQTIIPQKGALRSLIARFRKGGKVAFVLDQQTSIAEGGIVVDFLGLPMPVSAAPASLAYRTGTLVVFGFCLPQPGGRYRFGFPHTIIPPAADDSRDSDEVVRELTQQIQDYVSEQIRQHPEFWLWSYKHWRRVPGQSYPENYPAY